MRWVGSGKACWSRVLGIIVHPRAEWAKIREAHSLPPDRFLRGVLLFCAVTPISKFVGDLLFGNIRRPYYGLSWSVLADYALHSVLSYGLSVLLAFLAVATVGVAARLFSTEKSAESSRLIVYHSFIPYWVGGIFYLIPRFGGLFKILFSLYALYVLFLGFEADVLPVPKEKIARYFLFCSSVIVVVIAVMEILKLTLLFL